MPKSCNEQEILAALQSIRKSPSNQWKEQMLENIRALHIEENVTRERVDRIHEGEQQFSFSEFFWNGMKRFLPACAVLLVVLGGIFYFQKDNPLSAFESHVSNAEEALGQIAAFAESGKIAANSSLFPSAFADGDDEEKVATLVATVRIETEAAIKEIQLIGDAEILLEALARVDVLQEKTLEVVSDALLRLENDTVVDKVVVSLEVTSEQNAEIESSLRKIALDEDSENKIALNIRSWDKPESSDSGTDQNDANVDAKANTQISMAMSMNMTNEEDETNLKLEAAKSIVADIDLDEDELTGNMEKKWEKLQAIFEACDDDGENTKDDEDGRCQAGKAKGLAIAISAKARNEMRKNDDDDDKNDDNGKSNSGRSDKDEDDRDPLRIILPPEDPISPVPILDQDDDSDEWKDGSDQSEDIFEEEDHEEDDGRSDSSEGEDDYDDSVRLDGDLEIEGEVQLR